MGLRIEAARGLIGSVVVLAELGKEQAGAEVIANTRCWICNKPIALEPFVMIDHTPVHVPCEARARLL